MSRRERRPKGRDVVGGDARDEVVRRQQRSVVHDLLSCAPQRRTGARLTAKEPAGVLPAREKQVRRERERVTRRHEVAQDA
jgi:hypothetical protein